MVVSEKIEDIIHQERRIHSFEEADRNAGTGAPSSLARHDIGLSTVIGRENRDANGQIIDTAMCSKIGRLRTWDFRTRMHTSGGRNFMKAFEQLNRLKGKLALSDTIVEKTANIYRKVQERGFIRGRTIDGVLAAAVYISCRKTGTPRTIKDIVITSNTKENDVARCYKLIVFEQRYTHENTASH